MTRKDYVVIANAMKRTLEQQRLRRNDDTAPAAMAISMGKEHAIEQAITDMADALSLDNPRFNPQFFLEAAGWHG